MVETIGMGSRVRRRSGPWGNTETGVVGKLRPPKEAEFAREPIFAPTIVLNVSALELTAYDSVSYYQHQRNVVRRHLGSNWQDVEKFNTDFETIQKTIAQRAGIECECAFKAFREPKAGSTYVFMGMKGLSGAVAKAIQDHGIVALKYLPKKEESTDSAPVTVPTVVLRNDNILSDSTKSNDVRGKLLTTEYLGPNKSLDEYHLMKCCNAHKSGPGVDTSGFHSTSGKPDYAAQYSDGTPAREGIDYYNLGVAIAISDNCLPVMIAYAIQSWNERHKDQPIKMAFEKTPERSDNKTEVNLTQRDYESEILLGGASTAIDFGYLALWRVRRKKIEGGNPLFNEMKGKGFGGLLKDASLRKK